MDTSTTIANKDESFNLLFPPPDFIHADELTKVEHYLGKLADMRLIYKNCATELADQLDEAQRAYAIEKMDAATKNEIELKKMKMEITKCAENVQNLSEKNMAEKEIKEEMMSLFKSIVNQISKFLDGKNQINEEKPMEEEILDCVTIESDNESLGTGSNETEVFEVDEGANDDNPIADSNRDQEVQDVELNDDVQDGNKENVRPEGTPNIEALQPVPVQMAAVQLAPVEQVPVQQSSDQQDHAHNGHANIHAQSVTGQITPFSEQNPNVNDNASPSGTGRVKPRSACSECDQIFVKRAYWATHMKYDHGIDVNIPGKYVRANKRKSVMSEDNDGENVAADRRINENSPIDPAVKRHKNIAK